MNERYWVMLGMLPLVVLVYYLGGFSEPKLVNRTEVEEMDQESIKANSKIDLTTANAQAGAVEPSAQAEAVEPSRRLEVAAVNQSTSEAPLKQLMPMTDVFKEVNEAYQAQIAHPSYSRPLSEGDWSKLNPHGFQAIETVVADMEGASVSVELSRYVYFRPQVVDFMVTFYQAGALISGRYRACGGVNSCSEWMGLTVESDSGAKGELPADMMAKEWSEEVFVELNFTTSLGEASTKVRFTYVDAIATVTGFEAAYADQADYVIPVKVKTQEAGLYRLRANLFDSEEHPLAYLTAKTRLTEGEGGMDLRIHHSLLADQQGTLRLQTFVLERMSPAPGEPARLGASELDYHLFEAPEAKEFSDVAYQPTEQERQRLELLQHLSSS